MHKPPQSLESAASFDLAVLQEEMKLEDQYVEGGHVARTLIRTSDLRVVMMVMRAGSRIAEHQANQTATILVISGQIHVNFPSRTADLSRGQLLVLDAGLRHDIDTNEDSAFLLTLGWSADLHGSTDE